MVQAKPTVPSKGQIRNSLLDNVEELLTSV